MTWRRRRVLGAGLGMLGLAGCSERERAISTSTIADSGSDTTPADPDFERPPQDANVLYPGVQPTGNRYLPAASGDLRDVSPVTLPVSGEPSWLLAVGAGARSRWVVVQRDGTAAVFEVMDGEYDRIRTLSGVHAPPVGYSDTDGIHTMSRPAACAKWSRPLVVNAGIVCVESDGALALHREEETVRRGIDAPTDAFAVSLDESRAVCYRRRTDRYGHGALGDRTEPSGFVVFDTADGTVETEVVLDAPLVFEGLSPLVADLDGDGTPEIVTTIADSDNGARIRVYRPDGSSVATGPVYGSGWRHQLAVAPFAPTGTLELAVVRKPHVDHTLEFYHLADGGLSVTATHPGYSTHTYGSRNLDGALTADLDGDGLPELLVPRTSRRTLDIVARTQDGAKTAGSLPLDGVLSTNLTGATLPNGGLAIGAGTPAGVRVWQV